MYNKDPALLMPMHFEVGGVSTDLPPSIHAIETEGHDQDTRFVRTVEYDSPGHFDDARKGSVAIAGFNGTDKPIAIADLPVYFEHVDARRRAS